MKKELVISVLCILPIAFIHAASQEVILLPTKPGEPSEIIDPGKLLPGVPYLIQYDGGESLYELVGLSDADTFGVWFKPPAPCSLVAIYFQLLTDSDFESTPQTYEAFAAYAHQTIDFVNDYCEYHSCKWPGPSPIDSFIEGPTMFTADSMDAWGDWDTLIATSQPDIGTDIFFAGYIIGIPDSTPNPRIDAGVSAPYQALIWRQSPAGGGDPGWYCSRHLFWIRALVKLYGDIPPRILTFDRLPDTYDADREVTAHVVDFIGIPPDSHGVAWVQLHYTVNSGFEDTLDMVLSSGDSLDGVYSATISGISLYDTVSYYVTAEDYNGARDTSPAHSYIVRKGNPGNILLLLEDDTNYGVPYSHDPVSSVTSNVDIWDENEYGKADSSVLYYYHPSGPGQDVIFWFTWSGFHFTDEIDFLADFLDAGGKLFVSSEDLVPPDMWGYWVATPGHFFREYMKVISGYDDYNTDETFVQYGVFGDTITGVATLSEITVYPYYWAGPGSNWAGKFDELDPACVPIFYDEVDQVMGYRYEDSGHGYKVVWIYWPVHYIVLVNGDVEDNVEAQNTLIARTLDWFGYETGVQERESFSEGLFVSQSRPNPFANRTCIQYKLPQKGNIYIVLYNLLGQKVRTLRNEEQDAGLHTIIWDGTDNSGKEVPSGLYFLRLAVRPVGEAHTGLGTQKYTATRKLSVVR